MLILTEFGFVQTFFN